METTPRRIEEEKYMSRCIQLARQGICGASPNPMVGAVIVCDGKIIGEGYHRRYGEAHAEVNAVNSVKHQELLVRSTIYVSLEPCSHYGKTPPCTELIIRKKIPRVVIGCIDPFAKVAGRGVKTLRDAGVEVVVGVLEQECKSLNKQFMTFHSLKRPYVVLKWAESADGYMDVNRNEGKPVQLSTPLSGMLVHKKRAELDAIMVGTRTVLLDNPMLNVRNWSGKNPLRIVLDRELKIPQEFHVHDKSIPTWIITEKECKDEGMLCYKKLDFTSNLLPQLMAELHKADVQSLMVEGGSRLLQTFIDEGMWDEAYVEKATVSLEDGVKSPSMSSYQFGIESHFDTLIYHYTKAKCDNK